MVLETERLILREMTDADFDSLYKVLADSDIMCHYPYTFDEKRVRNWIKKNIERYAVYGYGLWAVCLKESGEMIGDCGITMQDINGFIRPEIGYHIAKEYQRNGYAYEAARHCRDWIFENSTFGSIYSYMKKSNVPSAATAISCGMRLTDEYTDQEGELTSVYRITRFEWLRRRKSDIRHEIRLVSDGLSEEYKFEAGNTIAEKLLASEIYAKAKSVFVYVSLKNEPATDKIIQTSLKDGKAVYIPRCTGEGVMEAVRIYGNEKLVRGKYGIMEPASGETSRVNGIDLIVIPCVSASYDGKRLGHGEAYYDRFLGQSSAYKVCLCFGELVRDDIPMSDHDVMMDLVISEKE